MVAAKIYHMILTTEFVVSLSTKQKLNSYVSFNSLRRRTGDKAREDEKKDVSDTKLDTGAEVTIIKYGVAFTVHLSLSS